MRISLDTILVISNETEKGFYVGKNNRYRKFNNRFDLSLIKLSSIFVHHMT